MAGLLLVSENGLVPVLAKECRFLAAMCEMSGVIAVVDCAAGMGLGRAVRSASARDLSA